MQITDPDISRATKPTAAARENKSAVVVDGLHRRYGGSSGYEAVRGTVSRPRAVNEVLEMVDLAARSSVGIKSLSGGDGLRTAGHRCLRREVTATATVRAAGGRTPDRYGIRPG